MRKTVTRPLRLRLFARLKRARSPAVVPTNPLVDPVLFNACKPDLVPGCVSPMRAQMLGGVLLSVVPRIMPGQTFMRMTAA